MFWLAPRARFRIYTRLGDYSRLLFDLLLSRTGRGDDVQRLENEFARQFGANFAQAVPQARVGIFLVIRALIRPGQKVVLSPYTIADVVNMVICAGGQPVFADIDRKTTNISAAAVEKSIDAETGAVMVTHLHGLPCEIEKISAICKAKRIPLIEDAAQCCGARVGGKAIGTYGTAGIFSFGMYKNITAFYGGMVVTDDPALHSRIQGDLAQAPLEPLGHLLAKVRKALFTDIVTSPPLFKTITYWIFRFGYLWGIRWINKLVAVELDLSRKKEIPPAYLCRFRPYQARNILRQLGQLDENTRIRIRYSKVYHEGLRDLPELIIAPFEENGSHIYNYFPIQYRDREALIRFLMQHRRDVAVQHLKNCAALPSFSPEFRECENAALTAAQTILLPNYPSYGEDEVRKTIGAIRLFFEARGSA